MDKDIIKIANEILNAKDIGLALEDLRNYYLKDVALTSKAIYDEHIEVGFTKEDALEIVKAYVIEFCRLEFVEE